MARVIIFTGNGKGKTTAALGQAVRAAGHGMAVLVVQFIKNRRAAGEYAGLERLGNVEMYQYGRGFVPAPGSPGFAEHCQVARQGLDHVSRAFAGNAYAIYVLDEICCACARGLIPVADLLAVLRRAPAAACVVLTGRDAPAELIDLADTVTEMKCRKHGYGCGIAAQAGVEF